MKKLFIILFLISVKLLGFSQQTPVKSTKIYGGFNSGYIFQNKAVNQNKSWHLSSGYFSEINFGYKKQNFGFGADLGYLNIKRNPKQFSNIALNRRMIYDSAAPVAGMPVIVSGLDTVSTAFTFGRSNHTQFIHKPLQSFYLLVGPEYWVGKGNLQAHMYAKVGVGYTKFGYYYVDGKANQVRDNKKIMDTAKSAYLMEIRGTYAQYGMTDKTYTASAPSPSGRIIDKYVIAPMAKAGIDVEYFITPNIAIQAGAGAFYIHAPKMKAAQEAKGVLSVYNASGTLVVNRTFSYIDSYKPNPLIFANANFGMKYFFGKQPKKAEKAKEEKQEAKDILITVKDQQTGLALSGVRVDLYRDGAFYTTGITDENGQLEKIAKAGAGNYEIKGTKNNITTTVANIAAADFATTGPLIFRELTHNDPRFTLIGYTVNKSSNEKMGSVNTILTNQSNSNTQNQNSDGIGKFIYQLDPQSDYTVVANQKGVFSNVEAVTTKGLDRSKTLYATLVLEVTELKQGNNFELKNILYDLDKHNIRSDAAKILDRLAEVLEQNQTIEIELSSHTDSRGKADYNLNLSQRRADAAVDYLVSKGINDSRLRAKGYGETRLKNKCADGVECSEAMHQANRRTEVKILKQ